MQAFYSPLVGVLILLRGCYLVWRSGGLSTCYRRDYFNTGFTYVSRPVRLYRPFFMEAWHSDQDYRYRFLMLRHSHGGTACAIVLGSILLVYFGRGSDTFVSFLKPALSANISETLSLPEFSVEGGEGIEDGNDGCYAIIHLGGGSDGEAHEGRTSGAAPSQ